MVQDQFASFLNDLAQALDMKRLEPDSVGACLIQFKNGLSIQFEPLQTADFLLITTDLGEVLPGRYREELFREALKQNGLDTGRAGTFSFNNHTQHLMLTELITWEDITGEKVANFLQRFTELALKWKKALETNDVPLTETGAQSSGSMSPFGLR